MPTITFTTDLGATVSVDVQDAEHVLEAQRTYGRLGWTSGPTPHGGHLFPLDNERDFDWALIGARKFTNSDGEEMVLHRGHAYRRRELEAVDSKKLKLPAAVKYSRGAKGTDPDHIREKADGEFEYVTLAIFRGGRRQERLAVPVQGAPSRSAGTGTGTTPAAPSESSSLAVQVVAAPATGTDPQHMNRGELLTTLNLLAKTVDGGLNALLRPYAVTLPSKLGDQELREIIAAHRAA